MTVIEVIILVLQVAAVVCMAYATVVTNRTIRSQDKTLALMDRQLEMLRKSAGKTNGTP
jgi:hypothetical protein